MISRCTIIGRVGFVDIKENEKMGKILRLSVAVQKSHKENNEWVNTTNWFKVSVMGDKRVDQLNDIAKGDTVFVEGDFSIYEYQAQNGEPKKDIQIVASVFRRLSKHKPDNDNEISININDDIPF